LGAKRGRRNARTRKEIVQCPPSGEPRSAPDATGAARVHTLAGEHSSCQRPRVGCSFVVGYGSRPRFWVASEKLGRRAFSRFRSGERPGGPESPHQCAQGEWHIACAMPSKLAYGPNFRMQDQLQREKDANFEQHPV